MGIKVGNRVGEAKGVCFKRQATLYLLRLPPSIYLNIISLQQPWVLCSAFLNEVGEASMHRSILYQKVLETAGY